MKSAAITLFIIIATLIAYSTWYHFRGNLEANNLSTLDTSTYYFNEVSIEDVIDTSIGSYYQSIFICDSNKLSNSYHPDTTYIYDSDSFFIENYIAQKLKVDCNFYEDTLPYGTRFYQTAFKTVFTQDCYVGYNDTVERKYYSYRDESVVFSYCSFERLFTGANRYYNTLNFLRDSFYAIDLCAIKIELDEQPDYDYKFNGSQFYNGININEEYVQRVYTGEIYKSTNIYFQDCEITGVLDISDCEVALDKITFLECIVDSINLANSKITNEIFFNQRNIYGKEKTRWWAQKSFWKFLFEPYFATSITENISIDLTGVDVSKIQLDFKYFDLYFTNATTDQKHSVYRSLIDKFKKEGKTESEELVTIVYQDFQGGPVNWSSKLWWNYGYSKGRVFVWTLLFLLIFTLINYRHLDYFKKCVYDLDFVPYSDKLSSTWRLWYSFIYTAIIFFSLKIHVEKLNYEKRGAVGYLLVIYILGIVCLAYMANFIISI